MIQECKIPAEIIIKTKTDDDSIDFASEGTLSFEAGGIFIEYDESELSGMPGAVTKIGISDDVVTVNRFGTYVTTIVFESGSKFAATILSPYGSLDLEVTSELVTVMHTENSINIELKYSCTIGDQTIRNEMSIVCHFKNREQYQ